MTMRVPMLDLSWQHRQIADEVHASFDRIMSQSSYILSDDVSGFESAFAAYCGAGFVIGVGNGTDALELALRGVGVGPGDEVIVPANTFVATAEAVLRAGATPVFADCREDFLIDPASVAERITPRTRAVLAVHLYGQPADMTALAAVCGDDILLLEDAAQAQGAEFDGRRAGSLGSAAGTSFYPGKNLGAYGDAGAVITSSELVAERIQRLRNHGGIHRYEHLEVGTNSRLDALQAAVLHAKLGHLDEWNARRRAIAELYRDAFVGTPVTAPPVSGRVAHVYHQFVVQVDARDAVLAALQDDGIGAGLHYPTPVHRLPAFAGLESARVSAPVAERTAGRILSLPIYPGLTDAQAEYVVERTLAAAERVGATAAA
jgi:dTDP-4-amino-4,6-dideoxygalactose transaminase